MTPQSHGTNHENCWRDCDRHPNIECFVFDCSDNPKPEYDCETKIDKELLAEITHAGKAGEWGAVEHLFDIALRKLPV